jgi:hypothetical protein
LVQLPVSSGIFKITAFSTENIIKKYGEKIASNYKMWEIIASLSTNFKNDCTSHSSHKNRKV